MNEALWDEPNAEGRNISRQSLASGFARMAKENDEWAGMPVPLMGERLTIEPSYWMADKIGEVNRIMNPEATDDPLPAGTFLRNQFYSTRLRCDVLIWQEADGRVRCGRVAAFHSLGTAIDTLKCAEAWSLETESRAMECLRGLVTHNQFRQYLLTGGFIESSKRSGIAYYFRRLRPTAAISFSRGDGRILAALCLHPIAYYRGTWAGAMAPTDDVVAHLMLMRGDEKMFWRRANQHPAYRPEAGL